MLSDSTDHAPVPWTLPPLPPHLYRHLVPLELTGIHTHYDMAHGLGRGTFATVIKAMSHPMANCWAVKIIHSQKLGRANANNNNNISILEKLNHPNICRLCETFVPEDEGHDFCEFILCSVSSFLFSFSELGFVL